MGSIPIARVSTDRRSACSSSSDSGGAKYRIIPGYLWFGGYLQRRAAPVREEEGTDPVPAG